MLHTCAGCLIDVKNEPWNDPSELNESTIQKDVVNSIEATPSTPSKYTFFISILYFRLSLNILNIFRSFSLYYAYNMLKI